MSQLLVVVIVIDIFKYYVAKYFGILAPVHIIFVLVIKLLFVNLVKLFNVTRNYFISEKENQS
jgi:hypothetical protein